MDPDTVRARLTDMKADLAARVARTHKHLHEREGRVSGEYAEQSAEMENQELVMSLDLEGRNELRQIEAALARLEEGSYGECTGCGQAISAARLDALPFASRCINCARSQEG